MDKLDNRAASPLRIADRGAGAQLHALQHPSWIEFVRFCSELKHGEIENLIFRDLQWSAPKDLTSYDFLEADASLVKDLAAGRLL